MDLDEFIAFDLEKHFGVTWREVKQQGTKSQENALRIQSLMQAGHLKEEGTMINQPCSKCDQQQIHCAASDMDTIDHDYTYSHICLNPDCLNADFIHFRACGGYEEKSEGPAKCYFCKRIVNM